MRADDPGAAEYVRGLFHGVTIAMAAFVIGLIVEWVTK